MANYSDYEKRVIAFWMESGMSLEQAECSILEERMEQFHDKDCQLTDENQHVDWAPSRDAAGYSYPNLDATAQKKLKAFRGSLGEKQWHELNGHTTDTRLLLAAIDFIYK